METNTKHRKKFGYLQLLVVFILLIFFGVGGMLFRHGDLYIHKNGLNVEGTVDGYEVNFYRGDHSYNVTLYCEYTDTSTNRVYHTKTVFSRKGTYAKCEEFGKSQLGKNIQLVIDDKGHCMAKRDMNFDLFSWIFLPRGIFIIVGVLGIVVVIIKKFYLDKCKQVVKNQEPEINIE